MTLEVKNAILCDMVRREDNFKLLAIGVYSATVTFSYFPAIAQFTLLANVITSQVGHQNSLHIRVKLDDELNQDMEGEIMLSDEPSDWIAIQLQPIQFVVPTVMSAEALREDGTWYPFFKIRVIRAALPSSALQPLS
jgi:hypothetical protein